MPRSYNPVISALMGDSDARDHLERRRQSRGTLKDAMAKLARRHERELSEKKGER